MTGTERYSLKTISSQFAWESIERCYLHGMWQQERGRNPTMLYGNHTDPKEAFASAQAMIGEYIESVLRIPFSRHHDWSIWAEPIVKGASIETLEKML